MRIESKPSLWAWLAAAAVASHVAPLNAAEVPVVTWTNAPVRLVSADLPVGGTYGSAATRIFQGLRPDVAAVQEFRYQSSSDADLREFVDTAFGPEFSYYREPGYDTGIPNAIISRFPILAAGSWPSGQSDRGFAWARLDAPGTNDLYVVSVHLTAGAAAAAVRFEQALLLLDDIEREIPEEALVVVGGNLNIQTRNEDALKVLTSLLVDDPIPTDRAFGGNANTDRQRAQPNDLLLVNPKCWALRTPTLVGSRSFPSGLVFDSRVFTPLSAVAPIEFDDSAAARHMAVVKDFAFPYPVTNWVEVPPPVLTIEPSGVVRWEGVPGITYTVEGSGDLAGWLPTGTAESATTAFAYTNSPPLATPFLRVRAP